VVVIAVTVLATSIDSCGLEHMNIMRGLETYDQTLDAELCYDLLYDIYEFNAECRPPVEIIDCG